MSMVTYPLNNIEYTAEDAELYLCTRESGVHDGSDFSIEIVNNEVTVEPGIAWIKNSRFSGKVVALKEAKRLSLSVPDSAYNRIDAVVIQFDANTNRSDILIKEGIASSNPIAPDVVRTESVYELHTFHIIRRPGSTSIGSNDVVDIRANYDYCGIMFDPISSIDNTLSVAGKAADSKAVGDLLAKKANIINIGNYVGDLNSLDIPLNSIAWVAAGTSTNCPTTSSAYLETWGSQEDVRFQRITTEGGSRAQRRYYNNAWTEWEWENPPLTTGKEYRTTERWNGHVVYVRGVSCGTLTTGRKVVEVPDLAKCVPVSTIGYVNQGSNNYTMIPSIYYSTDESSTVVVLVNTTATTVNIQLFVGSGYAGKTATVQVKYFKV